MFPWVLYISLSHTLFHVWFVHEIAQASCESPLKLKAPLRLAVEIFHWPGINRHYFLLPPFDHDLKCHVNVDRFHGKPLFSSVSSMSMYLTTCLIPRVDDFVPNIFLFAASNNACVSSSSTTSLGDGSGDVTLTVLLYRLHSPN